MKTAIGYLIHTIRLNAIVTFIAMQCICLYLTVVKPESASNALMALMYAMAFDSFVSCVIVIGLKNRKRI